MNVVGLGSWEQCQVGQYCFRSGDKTSWNQQISAFVGIPYGEVALQKARGLLTQAIEGSMADQLLAGLKQIVPQARSGSGWDKEAPLPNHLSPNLLK